MRSATATGRSPEPTKASRRAATGSSGGPLRRSQHDHRPNPPTLTRINSEAEYPDGLVRIGRDLGEKLHVSFQDDGFFSSRGAPASTQRRRLRRPAARCSPTFHAQRRGSLPRRRRADAAGARRRHAPVPALPAAHFRNPTPSLARRLMRTRRINPRRTLRARARTLVARYRAPRLACLRGWEDRLDAIAFDDPARLTLDAYVQDDARLFEGRLRLIPGVRFDATQGFGERFVPRVGAVLEPCAAALQGESRARLPRAELRRALLSQRGLPARKPRLAPEQPWPGTRPRAGLHRPWPLDRFSFEAAYFDSDIENSIVFVLISPSQ